MNTLDIRLKTNPELYAKNPESSDLGKRIVATSIELIHHLGFEDFTFKKLGTAIDAPESSIYRYFDNKRMLLSYLTSWYWTWLEYQLVFCTTNLNSAKEKLSRALDILTHPTLPESSVSYVNETLLSEIVFSESIKTYHTKEVDDEDKRGCFKAYKQVVQRVSEMVLDLNPTYRYPHMLISTVIEGAHQQKYFAEHIPELTDTHKKKDTITEFYSDLVFTVLDKGGKE